MKSDEPPNLAVGERVAAVILAAGLGTRMKSRVPKELHPVAGRPLVEHVLRAVASVHPEQVIVVLSPAKESIAGRLPADCEVAWQREQLGTGHAAAQAMPLLRPEIERVAILFGDHPLLTDESVASLLRASMEKQALVTLLTTELADPAAYGRLRREGGGGRIVDVVEAKADERRYDGPVEINSGISCYRRDWLERALPRLPRSAVGEFYLTSLVRLAAEEASPAEPVVSVVVPPETALGVNDRIELAEAEAMLRRRINERLMRSGVSIVDPATTFIDDGVEIGQDSRVEPFTTISGTTTIGERCRIGPQSIVRDSQIADDCAVIASMIEGARLGERVDVGPFSHLRPGTVLGDDVHIGNFAEIKQSTLGRETKMGHFSYVGDAKVGEGVNIGAGAVTANYDGVEKHPTYVGDRAFIGVDSILRAPVSVGEGAVVGAGSVVTRDVEAGVTVVGVPARPLVKRDSSKEADRPIAEQTEGEG